jgi:hypothetical protein
MVTLYLCCIKHYVIEKYGRVHVQHHSFLTVVPDEGEWLASSPGRFGHSIL